ncbi:hypothetical protein Tco_1125494 [Tanacetum coccineum]|uniref:Uncharacterized protein n=1 Tax=Tanacetum coccineum TaxID=301880 RepID=A0ABQ5J9N2_9ASTR
MIDTIIRIGGLLILKRPPEAERLRKKRTHRARGRCLVVTVALQRERTTAAAVELAPHTERFKERRLLYEVSCLQYFRYPEITYNMSNPDELRHTDNTTLVTPRFPDTLPQVYHRRRPTLGILILPSVSPFPPTIRCTTRISIPPIEPNLRMISETDPAQREEALTETGQNSVPVPETTLTVCTTRLRGQLHTILEDMDRYLNACLEELEAFMTMWDVKPRVEESSLDTLSMDELITQLRQICEDAEDRASNAQEEAR